MLREATRHVPRAAHAALRTAAAPPALAAVAAQQRLWNTQCHLAAQQQQQWWRLRQQPWGQGQQLVQQEWRQSQLVYGLAALGALAPSVSVQAIPVTAAALPYAAALVYNAPSALEGAIGEGMEAKQSIKKHRVRV